VRVIQTVLQGIPKVVVYLHDILITGETDEEYLQILDEVLGDWRQRGWRTCSWATSEV